MRTTRRFPVFLALVALFLAAPASIAAAAVRNGLIAYTVGGGEEDYVMRAIRPDGMHDRRLIAPTPYGGGIYRGPSGPQWSSDGKRLLFGAHSHLDDPAFGLKYATASGKRIR